MHVEYTKKAKVKSENLKGCPVLVSVFLEQVYLLGKNIFIYRKSHKCSVFVLATWCTFAPNYI